MNTICLVLDRLHLGYVGAYGNSWIDTPWLDRLATEAFLFDQYWLDSPQLEPFLRSVWRGRHSGQPPQNDAAQPALPEWLTARGVATTLISDELAVLNHPLAQGFAQRLELPAPGAIAPAGEWDETHLARLFAQLVGWLEEAREPFWLWCHLGSLGATWDAPYALRARYAADEDPPPPEGAEVPRLRLPENFDPDQVLGCTQAYAGQVTLLDTCLGALLDWLEESPIGKNTQFVLTSSRGFPLGEHRDIGGEDAFYGELLHVPLFWRLPDAQGAAARSGALVEPSDLWATLVESSLAGEEPRPASRGQSVLPLVRGEAWTLRDRLCLTGPGDQRAILTPAWYFHRAGVAQLYLKPDDRWEFNDVASRCPEIVELLEETLEGCQAQLQADQPAELPPLDPRLVHGMD